MRLAHRTSHCVGMGLCVTIACGFGKTHFHFSPCLSHATRGVVLVSFLSLIECRVFDLCVRVCVRACVFVGFSAHMLVVRLCALSNNMVEHAPTLAQVA